MRSHSAAAAASQRGSISVIAVFFALVIAGLSVTMIEAGLASRRLQARGDSSMYALEAAETGTAMAEQELTSLKDPDGDGSGNVSGTFAGLRYEVTATQDPESADRYTLLARGWHGQIGRRIETCVKRLPGGSWNYGLFGRDGITFGSNGASTDAYDSRLGSWASQAVNVDASGKYAQKAGAVGSNGGINLASQITIRGDASPGPGHSIAVSNNAVVTGDTTALTEEVDLPPTPFAEFAKAAAVNDNGTWTSTSKVNYDPVKGDLIVGKGNTITLTGKVYFFRSIQLSGNAVLKIKDGPVKIYITDEASLGGGVIFNETQQPINLQFYQYPYALPVGTTQKNNKASLSGGANAAFVMYAPSSTVTVSGNGAVNGAIVGKQIDMKGGAQVHFDLALRDQLAGGANKLQRLYWRDLQLPLR